MMNHEINNASDPVVTLAQHVVKELGKSGTKAWAGLPSPEEMEQLRAEKAERSFQTLKHRADAQDRRRDELKEAVKRKLKGEIADD